MADATSVAIVGAGLMGRWHARFAAAAGARVSAIVDSDMGAARRLAARHRGASSHHDLASCLREAHVDAVHVCAPTSAHGALAEEALDAGRHVLVEKPVATTMAETSRLLERARTCERLLCPVHQFPFQRGMAKLITQRARLGELVSLAVRIDSAGGDGRDEARRRAILREMLPHATSVMRPLVGAVGATGWTVLDSSADTLVLWSNAAAHLSIELSLTARPTRCQLDVRGRAASAHADLFHGFSFVEGGRMSRADKALAPFRHAGKLQLEASTNLIGRAARGQPAYPGLAELIAAFHDAVRRGTPAPISPDEVMEAAALMERA